MVYYLPQTHQNAQLHSPRDNRSQGLITGTQLELGVTGPGIVMNSFQSDLRHFAVPQPQARGSEQVTAYA